MLNRIELEHFKCFDLLRLPLTPLTLLSGTNSSGKSSVLQSLVLLHQNMREHEWSTRLALNGKFLRLGTVTDVVDQESGRNSFSIGLFDDDVSCHWTFSGDRNEMSMRVEDVSINGKAHSSKSLRFLLPVPLKARSDSQLKVEPLTTRLRRLSYLTAERVGPREVYSIEDLEVADVVGPAGEHAVSVLHCGRDEPVLPGLAMEGVPNTRLRQVENRMQTFFPGFTMEVTQVPNVNAVTLGLRTSNATAFHRPTHVGFGLTQILPIVVAALTSAKDDILLVENPEVHLHPAGQALMGQFLATVAQAGVQVIIETHSDHVLNGVRRAVKSNQIPSESVCLHFFRQRVLNEAQVVSPILDETGNIDIWPEGFFDQFDKDMNYFAGWGE